MLMTFPPFIAVGLGVLAAALVAHSVVRERRRAKADVERARRTSVDDVAREAIPKLRRDPRTGIYRP
jgi:hypothetical protein